MKDLALIGKLVGIWPSRKALTRWINVTWKPKGHYNMQLRKKGFFIIIFFNLEDWNIVVDGGPYFFNLGGLVLGIWKESFNLDKEYLMVAPI